MPHTCCKFCLTDVCDMGNAAKYDRTGCCLVGNDEFRMLLGCSSSLGRRIGASHARSTACWPRSGTCCEKFCCWACQVSFSWHLKTGSRRFAVCQPTAEFNPSFNPGCEFCAALTSTCVSCSPSDKQSTNSHHRAHSRQCEAGQLAVDCHGERPSRLPLLLEGATCVLNALAVS